MSCLGSLNPNTCSPVFQGAITAHACFSSPTLKMTQDVACSHKPYVRRSGGLHDLGLLSLQRCECCRVGGGGGGGGGGSGGQLVSFLPGCPECQLNLLKRQTSGPITPLLAPVTHKKTDSEEERSAGLVVCAVRECWQIVQFNEYTATEYPIKSSFERNASTRVQGEQTPLDVVWTHTHTHALISDEHCGNTHSRKRLNEISL